MPHDAVDKPKAALPLLQQQLLQAAAIAPVTGRVRDGRLRVRFTPVLQALLGVARAPRGGPILNAWVLAADRDPLQQAVARLIEHGEAIDVHYQVKTPAAGDIRSLHLLLNRDGVTARVTGVLRDETSVQYGESQRVLTQERLQSVSRLTLLGEVASGLAHEINQPLAAIATFAQAGERLLAMPESKLERVQQICREISQQALRAGDVINRMRNLVRRHGEQRVDISCMALLQDFLSLATPMARASGVELQTQLDSEALRVNVDVTLLHQVLMILFQNALDAARDQSPARVAIDTRAVAQGLEISVTDSGAGVSAADAAQMFRPFFSTKPNGTGLGLIACRKLLEGYGSQLQFANQPQRGCRFWFVLPIIA